MGADVPTQCERCVFSLSGPIIAQPILDRYWPLIGWEWSHGLDTGLWLAHNCTTHPWHAPLLLEKMEMGSWQCWHSDTDLDLWTRHRTDFFLNCNPLSNSVSYAGRMLVIKLNMRNLEGEKSKRMTYQTLPPLQPSNVSGQLDNKNVGYVLLNLHLSGSQLIHDGGLTWPVSRSRDYFGPIRGQCPAITWCMTGGV